MKCAALSIAASLLLVACGSKEPSSPADAGGEQPEPVIDAGVLVPFDVHAFNNVRITSISSEPNFQKAETEIDWGDAPKAKVELTVDLTSTCYPFEKWQANPPPSGQNWPADCDAFDRNFEFILDPPQGPNDPPGIELVRSITPFGGPEHLVVDLTDIANGRPGKHRLRTTITTWSDSAGKVSGSAGGWNVTADIHVEPGTAPRNVLAVVPLFNGSQATTGDSSLITFELPAGTVATQFEYRATGHGGGTADADCIGPAEEFCRRVHTLKFDGVAQAPFTPWRDDCQTLCTQATYTWPGGGTMTYCLQNPCGAISSVKAPRANWCPGSMTPPFSYLEAWRTPGPHTLQWNISKVASGGSWRLSAHVIAYGL